MQFSHNAPEQALAESTVVFTPGSDTAEHATFTNPIVTSQVSSPDPWLVYHEGYYYFAVMADGDKEIWLWKSPTISGIDSGEKKCVWRVHPTGPLSALAWAPELHFLNGRWYIYFAVCDGNNATHRMYVLESETADAFSDYREKGQITDDTDRWAIDGTPLQLPNGELYFLWSGWPGYEDGLQNIYIAPMSNPWTISGPRVLLSTPEYGWEGWINEGPQVLYGEGKIFVVYSANASWTADYCLGMLTYSGGDILDPVTWQKSGVPVFQKYEGPEGNAYCVGHCSFVKSPDGTEDWIIYHGKDGAAKGWVGRTARAQRFGWTAEGNPDFGHPVPSSVALPLPSGEAQVLKQL
ncbi:MAG TPA: glycoside hydrolase family 43 protein [Chloroflexia bacterium]|nr:glycoside hydrolase family 43 protein [Chloroflexia bacterium]